MWKDFKSFLLKQNALALAIAVVIGTALNGVVTALVDHFIMPVVTVVTPDGNWQTQTWNVGPMAFGVGPIAAAVLNFLIVGLVAWRLSKLVPAPPAPAQLATKACPHCYSTIDARATRCSACTAAV